MAGAMRRMGIYLGLVEDDDARAYGRYDARQSDHPDHDRRYARYEDSRYEDSRYRGADYADDYAERGYADDRYRAAGYADDELEAEELPAAREPEPVSSRRPVGARPLGLAPATPAAPASGATRVSAMSSGPTATAGAAGLAVREPVAAPEPAPAVKEPYRITTVHPRTYNDARQIGERFREGGAVIMNLTELDDADAKRLVDFAAGLIFGLRGSIERVTAKVFLLSPRDVDVTAEDKARIRDGGFFDQS
ncbi:cell division protein SepF [Geodermatophilus sp. SYSU D00691]